MADKLKTTNPGGVPASDLKRIIKDINRHKANASENAGFAGKAVSQALEQFPGMNRRALMLIVGLSKKEVPEAQATLRAAIDYADKFGMFDQVDAFDDMIPMLKRIVERAENVRPAHGVPSGKADAMDDLLAQGQEAPPVH